MARKKVNLAWIPSDAVRRATFKKRRRGLLKKVGELAVLCDVKACAVIYGPHEAQPEVWPSESEARSMLRHFKGLPETDQGKKMVNQEGFLRQRVKKLVDQLQRMEGEVRELEMIVLMSEVMINALALRNVGTMDATALLYFIDMKFKVVQEKIRAANFQMTGNEAATMQELPRDSLFSMVIAPPGEQTIYGSSNGGLIQMMQPFINNGNLWMNPHLFNF